MISAMTKPFSYAARSPGQLEQVRAVLYRERFLLRAFGRLSVNSNLGLDALLVVDLLDADEGIVSAALGGSAGHDDLLHETKLESPHRIEAVDEIVRVPVGGGISERT